MSLQIVPLDRNDVPAYARVELEAFRSHPRTPMVWTEGYNDSVYAYNENSKYNSLQDANEHSLKCFETGTGKMVAGATYTFAFRTEGNRTVAIEPPKPIAEDAPPPPNWPVGGNWGIARFYKINTPKVIQQYLGGEPYISKIASRHLLHFTNIRGSTGQFDCHA